MKPGENRMSAIRLFVPCVALFAVMATSSHSAGLAVEGEELARQWCVRCHNVEVGGPFKMHPPSFASIAVYRSDEQIYSRIMIPPLHSNMPQIVYVLMPDNIEHLIAYIRSLGASLIGTDQSMQMH